MNKDRSESQRCQLSEQRRKVDFDTYDVSVDELLRRIMSHRINAAPVYQRQFRWDLDRQSKLIESVLLGIPIPPLFMATNTSSDATSTWEVVDGLQRLFSLVNFLADRKTKTELGLSDQPLALQGLEKLSSFNNSTFDDLPEDLKSTLQDRPIKVIVLNDKSEIRVRFDLFERLNTGGISLTNQEIRSCIFRGEFNDLLGELASTTNFKKVVVLSKGKEKDGTPEEFVLRFFAFYQNYNLFDHSVKDFLDDFMENASKKPLIDKRRELFMRTFNYLSSCFSNGIKSHKGTTPVNLFEGISVGAALALERMDYKINPIKYDWTKSIILRQMIGSATNSRKRVVGRIEYCRDIFLEKNV